MIKEILLYIKTVKVLTAKTLVMITGVSYLKWLDKDKLVSLIGEVIKYSRELWKTLEFIKLFWLLSRLEKLPV